MNQDDTYIYDVEEAGDDSDDECFELTLVDSKFEDTIDGDDIELAVSLENELVTVSEVLTSSEVNTPRRRGRPRKETNSTIVNPVINSSQIIGFYIRL